MFQWYKKESSRIVSRGERSKADQGCFPVCSKFQEFRSESKWKARSVAVPSDWNIRSHPCMEVVHFDSSDCSDRNLLFHIDKLNRFIALLLFSRFHLYREFGKEMQNGKSRS